MQLRLTVRFLHVDDYVAELRLLGDAMIVGGLVRLSRAWRTTSTPPLIRFMVWSSFVAKQGTVYQLTTLEHESAESLNGDGDALGKQTKDFEKIRAACREMRLDTPGGVCFWADDPRLVKPM